MSWWSVASRSRPMCSAVRASNRPARPEKGPLSASSERCVFKGIVRASGASEKANLTGQQPKASPDRLVTKFYTYPQPTPTCAAITGCWRPGPKVSGAAAPHSPGSADHAALRRWTMRCGPGSRLLTARALVRMVVGAHGAAGCRPSPTATGAGCGQGGGIVGVLV